MSSPQTGHIFISYRRADSEGYAGRIYDRITPHFGAEAVFMDVDTIDAGVDFVKVLEDAVQSCDVLVALIGRRWLNLKDENGARRLDNPEDFVRVEIATALERDIRVIPVLVGGASMPGSIDLPENLKPLARRNALTVNHATFHADMSRLVEHLERALQAAEDSRILKAKKLQEEQARREHQAQIEKLLHQSDTAINLSDWKLAGEKLKEILAIDPGHLEAQAKLELVQEKETIERSEKEEARKRKEKREREAAAKAHAERLAREKENAEGKTRQAALRKERQRENMENFKKFFANLGKLPYFIGGGIVLLFALGYIISKLDFPLQPEPTQALTKTIHATTTLSLPTLTSLPTSTSRPISTATPTEIPATPTPVTMVSEKDGMTMVYVPAGEFQMGSEDGEDNEKPVHTVYLDAYWIDQTEVSNAQFSAFAEQTEHRTEAEKSGQSRVWGENNWESVVGADWRHPQGWDSEITELSNHPVIHVSWNDAQAYCEWAGAHLPTEAEWEKAARGGVEGMAYPWGDEFDGNKLNSCDVNCPAIFGYNFDDGYAYTSPVANFAPNAFGVYDMVGNVREWVADRYDENYYISSPTSNPTGPDSGSSRVVRGGGWLLIGDYLRSSKRGRSSPTDTSADIGFRCSRSAE